MGDTFYNFTKEIPVIIPEGYRSPLSVDTNTLGRFCIDTGNHGASCAFPYRAKIRGMVTKMPGFEFSAY